MCNHPSSWVRLLMRLGFIRENRKLNARSSHRRNLHFEQCEDRCMLATFSVANHSDAIVNTPAAVGTLRQAIFDASQSQDALDTINFSETAFANGGSIQLTEGQLSISESNALIIDGRNTAGVSLDITINAGGGTNPEIGNGDGFRIFNISGAGEVEINSLTLTGGDPGGDGGAIYSTVESLVVKNSTITGNASGDDGGGIFSTSYDILGSSVRIEDSTVSGNTAGTFGGGVFAKLKYTSSLTIEESVISGNTATYDGGGVYAKAFTDYLNPIPARQVLRFHARRSRVTRPAIVAEAAYLFNYDGTETLVEDSRITDNHVPYTSGSGLRRNGGGIYAYLWDKPFSDPTGVNKPKFTITGSTVDNNDAYQNGGGIFVCDKYNGDFVAANSTISGNSTVNQSTGGGGGLFIAHFDGHHSEYDYTVDGTCET